MLADTVFQSLEALVATIPDGAHLALPKDESGAPCEAVREMIRQKKRGLRLLCVPACGYHADLLIGAGCVDEVEMGGIVVGELGVGQRFQAAVRAGTIRLKDSSCPALHSALQAGAKGTPFAAVRGFIGSDLLKIRGDWKVVDNPFGELAGGHVGEEGDKGDSGGKGHAGHEGDKRDEGDEGGDPILVVPAINPDVFVFHARWGDRHGNVWTGGRRDLGYAAQASRRTLVTVESMREDNLLADPILSAGTLDAAYVSAVAHVPRGSWPMTLQHVADEDSAHIAMYARMARTDEGFAQYAKDFVFGRARVVA